MWKNIEKDIEKVQTDLNAKRHQQSDLNPLQGKLSTSWIENIQSVAKDRIKIEVKPSLKYLRKEIVLFLKGKKIHCCPSKARAIVIDGRHVCNPCNVHSISILGTKLLVQKLGTLEMVVAKKIPDIIVLSSKINS